MESWVDIYVRGNFVCMHADRKLALQRARQENERDPGMVQAILYIRDGTYSSGQQIYPKSGQVWSNNKPPEV